MHQMTQWQQTDTFDPYNPNQIVYEPNNRWGPGTTGNHASVYFNKQPVTAQNLEGLNGSFSFSGLPVWLQMVTIAGLAGVVGYFGLRYVGPRVGLKAR